MAMKHNLFSFIAGVAMPSVSQKSLVYNEAVAMGDTDEQAAQVAEKAYRTFRNSGLFDRYGTLMDQDSAKMRAWISKNVRPVQVAAPVAPPVAQPVATPAPAHAITAEDFEQQLMLKGLNLLEKLEKALDAAEAPAAVEKANKPSRKRVNLNAEQVQRRRRTA